MKVQFKLHIGTVEPEVMETLAALLTVLEDVRPAQLTQGDLSREDIITVRERVAAALWDGQIDPGQLSLRWLHRESRWQSPTERSGDEFVQVHQGMALIDMLDFLIAGLRTYDRLEIKASPGESNA